MSPPPSSSSAGAGEFFRGAAVVSATREGFEAEGAADSFVDLAQRAVELDQATGALDVGQRVEQSQAASTRRISLKD